MFNIKMTDSTTTSFMVPPEFVKLINQFTDDLCATFPEHGFTVSEWWGESVEQQKIDMLWQHCCQVYTPYFADIMQENDAIFTGDDTTPIMFLPNIDFCTFWNDDTVSDATKSTIWRYLQCIVLQVFHNGGMGDVEGELKSMFDGMSENMEEMASKFQDMAEKMKEMFQSNADMSASATESEEPEKDASTSVPEFLKNFQSHVERMMEGKIGRIAKDLAEEVAQELGINPDDTTENTDKAGLMDMFQKIMKNPAKMMDIMKKCSQVIKSKIQSGEISEEELREELAGLMGSVSSGSGAGDPMEEIKKMFSSMGMDIDALMKMMMGGGMPKGMGGGKMRMDTNKINSMMRREDAKQRMRTKFEEKQRQKEEEKERAAAAQAERELNYKPLTEEEIAFLSTGIGKHGGASTTGKKSKKKK